MPRIEAYTYTNGGLLRPRDILQVFSMFGRVDFIESNRLHY